jgi:predicted PurR-regulated permease PerM
MKENNSFNRKIIKTIFISLLMLSFFALLVFHVDFFLLVFGGILCAVVLNYTSNLIAQKFKLKYNLSFAIVLLLILVLIGGIVLMIGPSIGEQVTEMMDTIPKSIMKLKEDFAHTSLGQNIINQIPDNPGDLIKDKGKAFTTVVGSFLSAIGAIANFFIIIVIGIFIAANPIKYRKGFIRLFPVNFRERLSEVMDKIYHTLSLWMMAKLISMSVVGILTAIGLQILGIPLPYALALIAALLCFIPNIGPYLGLIPAVLIAFLEGPEKALFVIILYTCIQLVETYMITPFVEKKMVSLLPALTILWMILIGLLTGVLGLILATPILVVLIVIIEELYVKDYLEKQDEVVS